MWVVGDMAGASVRLNEMLKNVTAPGFVSDLAQVLRPNDIHVIPWEYETGQRTRLVQAFKYGQAVVATRKSVSCFPEAVDDHNCILVDSLEEMSHAIIRLRLDDVHRTRLGKNARATFISSFTRDSLMPRYKLLIDSISSSNTGIRRPETSNRSDRLSI